MAVSSTDDDGMRKALNSEKKEVEEEVMEFKEAVISRAKD